jgi:hypothetical protein
MFLREDGSIEYFDSYGDKPEAQRKWISQEKLEELGEEEPYLFNLLKESGKKVYYNTYPYQTDRNDINTCGRWCVARLIMKDYSNLQFYNAVRQDMKEKGIIDPLYNDIFENDKDFYLEIQHKLNIKNREDAKELFMFWVNSNGYVPNFNIHMLFPIVSKYIKDYKSGDYKNMSSHLQRVESKIWIDDIMNNTYRLSNGEASRPDCYIIDF